MHFLTSIFSFVFFFYIFVSSLEEEDTVGTGAMGTGATETGAMVREVMEVATGALVVAVDTEVVANTPLATEIIGKDFHKARETVSNIFQQ